MTEDRMSWGKNSDGTYTRLKNGSPMFESRREQEYSTDQ